MSLISIQNLTFAYEGSYDNIFEKVSFQIDTDWRLGFIGRNGRGKTTFLNLLLGKYPYQGKISGTIPFDYFPFPIEDEQECPADVLNDEIPLWKLCRELSLLQADEGILYRPFYTLSGGEKTKVMMAMLFSRETNFLLIDEPTNHLDLEARAQMGKYLRTKKGFLLVSHDRILLDQCVDHILSINKEGIEIQRGNFSSWNENRLRRDAFELAENEKHKHEMKRLDQAARQTSRWSDKIEKTKNGQKVAGLKPDKGHIGAQAARMMKRSKSIEHRRLSAAEEKGKLLKNLENTFDLKLHPLEYHSHRLITMNDVQIYYSESPASPAMSFVIDQGDRIALSGKNGSGKTSLLKLILGEDLTFTGNLQIGSQLKISYVPQDTGNLTGGLSEYARQCGIDESQFKAILNKLDFSQIQFGKKLEDFSQGQKKKVLIARSLCEEAHLYIWDEPLNYIDVFSRMQIEELLTAYEPTMIFVEHDRAFTNSVATRKLNLTMDKH